MSPRRHKASPSMAAAAMPLEELDRWLQARVDRHPGATSLPMLDGYAAAIVAGPVSMSPLDWICPLLAIDADAFNHGNTPEFAAISAVALRHNEISQTLSTTPNHFEPMHRRANGDIDPRPWCQGFYAAMHLRISAWGPLLHANNVNHGLLLPSCCTVATTAAGATASAEPLVCDIRGEIDLRLNFRPASDEDVAQVVEPGQRGGAPGARGGAALVSAPLGLLVSPVVCSSCLVLTNAECDPGDQGNAEGKSGDPDHFDVERRSWVKFHASSGRAATFDQCWISLRKWALRTSICFNSAAAFSSPRLRNGRASLFIKANSRSSAATVHAGYCSTRMPSQLVTATSRSTYSSASCCGDLRTMSPTLIGRFRRDQRV